jgi:16S rRNA (uracil1498-N3)-methyltransferase
MFNFFIDCAPIGKVFRIDGTDYNHIKNVLRMKVGESLLVSYNGKSNLCKISSFENETVVVEIVEENYQDTSLPVEIHLFQGLPKSDKLELIIQKTVELGVNKIIPVEMSRSIVKIEAKKADAKTQRWQAIAESAAKQSKRTIIPSVQTPIKFTTALQTFKELDLLLVTYASKNGMKDTEEAFSLIKPGMKIGVVIGPEGGFADSEIEKLLEVGGKVISLGKRILRTETASILSVGAIMLFVETKL